MVPFLQTISNARFQDLPLGHSRKKQTEGVEELEFPRVLKKEHVEIPQGSIKKEVEFPRRSWFLALESPRGVTQFCGISTTKALLSLEFTRVK